MRVKKVHSKDDEELIAFWGGMSIPEMRILRDLYEAVTELNAVKSLARGGVGDRVIYRTAEINVLTAAESVAELMKVKP